MDSLKILIIEDSEEDTKILLRQLRRSNYEPIYKRVETEEALRTALNDSWDVVVSDYVMPEFDGLSALKVLQNTAIDIPFIIVSGSIGEEVAVAAMKAGAHDYLMKDSLSRLVPVIERELREAQVRKERREAEQALHNSYEELERRVQERTAELASVNEMLQSAVKARDIFLSVAAHELKTPISSLVGFAQIGLRQLEKTKQVDHDKMQHILSTINIQADKLSKLIAQLLDNSRLEAGHLLLERSTNEVVSIAEEVIALAQMSTDQHQVVLHANPPTWAFVDRLRLDQVLSNLVTNAVKYSAGGTITVDIWTEQDTTLYLAVQDQGLGIPVEHREHIFERFYQVHEAGYKGGMGLGLYISRNIVELHGGQLVAEFPVEGGTRFVVSLPLHKNDAER